MAWLFNCSRLFKVVFISMLTIRNNGFHYLHANMHLMYFNHFYPHARTFSSPPMVLVTLSVIRVGYRSVWKCHWEDFMVGYCPVYQKSYRTFVLRSHRHTILCLGRNWQTTRFMEVEVAVRLLYMLAEALPVSHGAHFSGDVSKASALQDMMRTVGILRILYRKQFSLCAVLRVS